MATIETHDLRNGITGADGEHCEEQKSIRVLAGGSIVEAADGLAVVVSAILGLAGVVPLYMAFIATILLGVALLFKGWVLASWYSKLLSDIGDSFLTLTELGREITAEFSNRDKEVRDEAVEALATCARLGREATSPGRHI
jgi:hypothetical protein